MPRNSASYEEFAAAFASPGTNVVLPVWCFPGADSEAFDFVKYIALPAVGAQGVIISFQVPDGYNGIIKRLGNVFVGAGFTEGAGGLQWQLLSNNVPIANYENIPASLGATANPSEVYSIRIKQGELIQLVINNISLVVGGAFAGGRLGGWFYPVDQEPVASV
jgi:hypothetical protein